MTVFAPGLMTIRERWRRPERRRAVHHGFVYGSKRLATRFFSGRTRSRNRPTLFLELFFDVVVAVVLGGISSKTLFWLSALDSNGPLAHTAGEASLDYVPKLEGIVPQLIAFYSIELVTALLVWRAVTHHMLRYRDSIHLRLAVFAVMVPFILTAASSYLAGNIEELSQEKLDFFFRFNVYSYASTALVVALIYMINAFASSGLDRRYNLLYGIPFLVVGAIIIPLVSGLLTSFDVYDERFWRALLVVMGGQLLLILIGQRAASRKKFNSFLHMKPENLKDRYNSLFLLFVGEFLLTIIDGWVESDPASGNDIAVVVMSICFALVIWWRYTNHLDYLDMKKTHKSMFSFSFFMLLSICFMIFVADGLSMWMKGAQTIGTLVFATCSIGAVVTSNFVWFSFKRYKESTKFILPLWAIILGTGILNVGDIVSIVLATVSKDIVINEACVLGASIVYVVINSVVFYYNTNHPVTDSHFLAVKGRFHYEEEHSLAD